MPPYYAMLSRLLSLDAPSAIAHRGGSKLRPENTLAAFQHALTLGVEAVECDVRLAADGEPVVIHDEDLDRTTDHAGPVGRLSAHELRRVDAAARFAGAGEFPFRGLGIHVPTLAEVLSLVADRPVIVEVKGDVRRTAERTMDVIRAAGAADRVILGGFSHDVLGWCRSEGGVVTSASRQEVQAAWRRSWFGLAPRQTGFDLLQVPVRFAGRRVLSPRLARAARRKGIPVHAWVVDDAEEMETLMDWGVTGLISDRPDLATAAVRRRVAGRDAREGQRT